MKPRNFQGRKLLRRAIAKANYVIPRDADELEHISHYIRDIRFRQGGRNGFRRSRETGRFE